MSMLTVTKFVSPAPRFWATVSAFRKTSGSTTADPMFKYTPPDNPATAAANSLKSLNVARPVAAPAADGCM